jgi:DNA-binding SARP family transcriptional activator/tetratricopeptide (TPR) repeat protein
VTYLVTLGSLQLNGDSGALLTGRRKVLALLACLARRAPEPVRRSELALLLWGDRGENHAKQSLRQALAELRHIFGDALLADAESVLVDPEVCALDARAFEGAVRLERWEEAAHLWGGDFLHGLDSVGGEAWAKWLSDERARLRQGAAAVFRALHAVSERRDDRKFAVEWALKWCEVAPLDEDAHAARIGSLVRSGRPVDAAVCYEGFIRRLHNESHSGPSAAFEALKETFAAGRTAATDTVVVRGTVTLSGLSQLGVDARGVAEAAAVIDGAADEATLQAISHITSFSFKTAVAELVQHGILAAAGEGKWEFTSSANRDRVFGVISADRRLNLQRAVAARLGTPVETKRAALPRRPSPARQSSGPRFRPEAVLAAGIGAVVLVIGANWAFRVATASAVELKAGSTVLLDHVRTTSDPELAGAVNTAATLGLSQSRHVALYKPRGERLDTAADGPHAERIRELARRERIPRIIALDITGTDSALRVAARLIDGSSGEVLGEESIDTRRTQLVDDLDRLLRKVRVTLGESEEIVRDSSRLLREVGSASIEALSAYADGMEAWSADRTEQARAAWTRALERDTAFALAELALANDAFTREDTDEGDRWVRRAIKHAERLTAIDALRARQTIALRDGRLAEASKLAEQVARRAPSSQAWFEVGAVHVAGNKCAEAIAAFERALAIDSTHAPSRLGLADCAVAQGNTALALKQLETAWRIDSAAITPAVFGMHRGRALARAGRYGEADTAFRAMFAGAPMDSATAYQWLAQLQMMRGRYGEALPMLQHAARLIRQAGDAQATFDNMVLEATAYTAIGGRTRASDLIDEAAWLTLTRPISVNGYFQLGHLMARVGRLNGAREMLRQASVRAAQEGAASAWSVRLLTASVYVAERNATEALSALAPANAPHQLEPFRLALLADANAIAGQYQPALEAAKRLSEEWHFGETAQDEWLRAMLRLARISESAGDTATARAMYRKYVDRWKDADVFLVELSAAQRALVRLGGTAVASAAPSPRGQR